MQRLEVEELTRHSTDVFYGQIISTETYWNPEHTRIYTGVRVRINETFKGAARRGDLVKIVQLGGEKDGARTEYSGRPEFTANESVVLFTTRTKNNDLTVVALKQGKMQVNGETVTRDFSGLTLLDRNKSGSQQAKAFSSQLTLNELRQQVAHAK